MSNENCILGSGPNDPNRVLLWGDSNAAHYIGVIGAFSQDAGFKFRNIAVGSCPPITRDPGPYVSVRRATDCRKVISTISAALSSADVVVLSANYPEYIQRSANFLETFFATVRELTDSGKLVILIGKAPVIAGYDRRCREKSLSYPSLECPRISVPPNTEVDATNEKLKQFADNSPNVEYLDINSRICLDGRCSAFDSRGNPLYYDPGHLAMTGSWAIGQQILDTSGVPKPIARISEWLTER